MENIMQEKTLPQFINLNNENQNEELKNNTIHIVNYQENPIPQSESILK